MNNRTSFLLTLIYGLIIMGLITRSGAILALAIPLALYLAVGLIFAPEAGSFRVERQLSANRVRQDEPLTVQLKITNLGAKIENTLIQDLAPNQLTIIAGTSKMLTTLDTGQTLTFAYTLSGKRGAYHFPGVRITSRDHLGLRPMQNQVAHSSRLLVLPDAYKLLDIAIRPRRTRVYPGLIQARKGGAGVEFFGLREYRSGDPRRWINDRVSARHAQTLFVNEFEQERAVDIGIILDCRIETNCFQGNSEILEHSIQTAATLANSFLNFGNRVGLLIYGGGRNWVHPGYGKIQKERILQALASVRIYENIVSKELSNLPTRLFPARSQLVLISALLYQDLPTLISLRAQGYQLLVISPDPIAFESRFFRPSETIDQAIRLARLERNFLLRQLRKAGVRVFDWDVAHPFHQVAPYALTQGIVRQTRLGGAYA